MSRIVDLIFSDAVAPEGCRELVESLGGVQSPDPAHPHDTRLERDDGRVLVGTYPVGQVSSDPKLLAAYEEVLGAPPRSRVVLEVSGQPGSEWLAAEIVLAAAERWNLLIDDMAEEIISYQEFLTRLSKRSAHFFLPEGRFDPSPAAMRKSRVESLTLILPSTVRSEDLETLLRSLGAEMNPDDRTDAHLSRDGAHVWVYLRAPGGAPVVPERLSAYEEMLGGPAHSSAALDVFEGQESKMLAVELMEAIGARWNILISGPAGQLMTLEDVRDRLAAGASDLFSP
jgi:hypothetical protein